MSPHTDPLIDPAALHAALSGTDAPTVIDVRWKLGGPSQRSEYDSGHLPGSAWVEFEECLTGTPGASGRHPMPPAEVFTAGMRAAGVRDDRPVVAYDEANSLAASRLWWLLRYFGKDDVRVLDGGLRAWTDAGYPLERTTPAVAAGDFHPHPRPGMLLDADGALALSQGGVLLDARPADRFAGRNETMDPVAGHIPGAISAPALENVGPDGRFLPPDELARRFAAHGITSHGRVGTYCGSGVQAAHEALALEISGIHPDTAVYVGSWSHWVTDPTRPVDPGH